MKRALCVAVGLATLVSSGLANTAPRATAAQSPVRSPAAGVIFNNPAGTPAQQQAIITQINRAIDAAPRGAVIRMAQYRFDIDSTADKLIAAHRRGVNVRVLIDDGYLTAQHKRVRAVVGTNEARPSFVTTCKQSCMSNAQSVMHAKFFLFSAAGQARLVSMISSANPQRDNTYTSWNNIHTVVGNRTVYNSLTQYFNDLIKDRTNLNYYRTTSSGPYKLYKFPRAARAGTNTVLQSDVLNNVSCTGVARGYGSNGRTVVRVAIWGWSLARLNLARQLWQLHDKGCKVEVILNSQTSNPKVRATLLKRSSRYGVMPVFDAWQDKNRNGKPELYVHHKALTVNGRWFGRNNTKVVYTGSQNFTNPGTRLNDELVLRVKHNSTVDAYHRNFNLIRDSHSKRLTRAS
jgi:phosphatidylserine/phosphatidylglycerophosphate/cardiolipin synthase-like enzyme